MTLPDYLKYKKGMEELTNRVKFIAHYDHGMYPFYIYFVCGKFKQQDLYKAFREDFMPHDFAQCLSEGVCKYEGTCYSYKDGSVVINVSNIMFSPTGIAKVAHEATHAVIQLSEYIDNRLSLEGQEAWCYFLDDVVEKYFIFQEDAIQYFLKYPKFKDVTRHMIKSSSWDKQKTRRKK